jgi:hypothetical protein
MEENILKRMMIYSSLITTTWIDINKYLMEKNENTSYSAMLNIREPVPHPESITTNSSDSGITSTSYPTEFLPFPSNSGIPIYMDDRQAILLKHASNSDTEFRESQGDGISSCNSGIPGNSCEFLPIPTDSASI